MSILVTGGAGFIGSHFIEHLLATTDEPIVCLDNFNDYYSPALKRANVAAFADHPRVTVVEGSFCDCAAMRRLLRDQRIRRIVHLGAYAGVRPSVANPFIYEQTNVGGSLSLLEAARGLPIERFLLISSSTVYGRASAVPFVEDAPLGIPLSPYGATKRAAEIMALTYHDLHRLPVVCLRPFSVYGPRLRPDLALSIFAEAILTGRSLPLFGDGSARRDFTHVHDICQGLAAALQRPNLEGQTINLGHHQPIEMREVIAALEEALGCKAQIEHLPARSEDMAATCADLSKAQRLLDYRPIVPFEDGLRGFAEWFRCHHSSAAQPSAKTGKRIRHRIVSAPRR